MKKSSIIYSILLYLIIAFSCKSKQTVVDIQEVPETPMVPSNADSEISTENLNDEEKKNAEKRALLKTLNLIDGISAKIIDDQNSDFHSMYELQIEQPVDHFDSKSEKFTQKVYLSHKDYVRPMVMYLNGYTAGSNSYTTEATGILEANQLHVEHRFFSQSRPESIPWNLLTIQQSAYDHHRIVELLKRIYKEPWVSTGISKGGMATIFHKRFFPNDVAVAMPYVAPVNLERNDQRIYEHLKTVGTDACRNTVLDYQKALFLDYDNALKLFKEYSNKAGYKYPHGYEASFELSVFEFSFAFWQWSGNCDIMPADDSTTEDKMKFLFYQIV